MGRKQYRLSELGEILHLEWLACLADHLPQLSARLDERNRYLEFLRSEFGVFNGLADGVLMAVDANGTLRNSFAISRYSRTMR